MAGYLLTKGSTFLCLCRKSKQAQRERAAYLRDDGKEDPLLVYSWQCHHACMREPFIALYMSSCHLIASGLKHIIHFSSSSSEKESGQSVCKIMASPHLIAPGTGRSV